MLPLPSGIVNGIEKKVIIATFSHERSPIFSKTIEFQGGVVYEFPLLKLSLASDLSDFDWCAKRLNFFDLVIFSSPNMVKKFFERLEQINVKPSLLDDCYVLSIGAETTKALNRLGVSVDISPAKFTSDQAVKVLRKIKKRWNIFIPCSDKSLWRNSSRFEKTKFNVYTPVLYTNEMNVPDDPDLIARVIDQDFDCVVFTSPSGVDYLSQICSSVPISNLLSGKVVGSIGPTTTEACRRHGITVSLEPRKHLITSLMWSIISHFNAEKRRYM